MEKLERKLRKVDVAPYYGTRVSVLKADGSIATLESQIKLFDNVDKEEYKLILHPLSDLVGNIEVLKERIGIVNSEEITPIVELFNMLEESDVVDYSGDYNNLKLHIDDDWNYGLVYSDGDQSLNFTYGDGSFLLSVNGSFEGVSNQLELFKTLFKWGFDVGGLIEKGLAVNNKDYGRTY